MNNRLFASAILGLSFVSVARAAVDLSLFRIEETRTVQLVEDQISHSPDQLKITLSLKGPEADAAVKFGKLKLDQAVDDRGTNLIPKSDDFKSGEKFQEYSNAFFRKFDLEQKKTRCRSPGGN